MAQPQAYNRETDFTERDGDDTNHAGINAELDAAALSINELRDNLALIQRDDGALKNGIVTAESLSDSAFNAVLGEVATATAAASASADRSTLFATQAEADRIAAQAAAAAAQSSQTAAATSATAAANSQTAAANSATSASNSASTATTKANDASASATNSANSATAAAGSATTAATQATNAAASATAAATSATNSANSATTATTQAGIATTQASNAAASAAAAAASFDDFEDRYLGPKSAAPTTDNDGNPLLTGALYFDTNGQGEMRVWNGSVWKATGSAVNGTTNRATYTATAGQTTFAIVYDVGFVDVYLNGLKLQAVAEFTATNGTSIVLATGATAGDIVDIVSYGVFSVANLNAALVEFTQSGTGAVARTVDAKLKELVSVKDFGATCDGAADDTVAMIAAFNYCRTNGKTLLLEGQIVFNTSSVPAGDKHTSTGGDYVYASSMIALNKAELLVNGKIGFDLTGVDRTVLQGFKVTTSGREMTEAQQNNTSPTLFVTFSGSKASAVYRDLIVYNNVTDLTGAYRAGAAIREYGCDSLIVDNVIAHNTIGLVSAGSSTDVSLRNIYGYNIETNVYLNSCQNFQITNSHLINNVTQRDYWIGRTASPAREINGMDNVLTEECGNGTVIGLHTVFAIERACYIQASQVHLSDCFALNCDAYKLVGNSYTSQVKDIYVNNCHGVIDANWSATRGRSNNVLIVSYWGSNLNVQNCSIRNDVFGRNCIQAVLNLGRGDGATYENVYIRNVTGINANRFVYSFLTPLTAAQLAALTPAGSFVSVRNLVIEDCNIKKDNFRVLGSLFVLLETGASADALLNYAAENLQIRNNTVELPATAGSRDDWLFDMRWVNGATSESNTVNLPFVNNGFFIAAVTQPYANIRMNEPYLKHSAGVGNLITQLGNLSVAAGSSLKFSFTNGTHQFNVEAFANANGTFLDQRVTAEIFGKGYTSVATTRSYGLEMNASGNFYFGKMISGVKTDQVSTPPVALTVSGTGVEVRGDLQPTVDYYLKMTLV